jgi:class 3 adenylate cyclase
MPAQPAGSHTGTATILFTDLVGSTAQRAQLGEEAAEGLRRAHDRLLTEAVAAHEARPWVVRTRRGWAAMLLDRDAPGDRARAAELIAAGRAEAEQLGMARELVRFSRLKARL